MMFGDYLDEDSQVRKTWDQYQVKMGPYKQDKQEPELRGYRVFEGLNVDPSVLYLERVREEV
jgi:molybdopterin-containing oxidoreductase family iron-sulfur binding subunit